MAGNVALGHRVAHPGLGAGDRQRAGLDGSRTASGASQWDRQSGQQWDRQWDWNRWPGPAIKRSHGAVGVRQGQFFPAQVVLDEERALPDPPQSDASGQPAQQHLLGTGEAKQLTGAFGLPRGLAKNDPRFGVGEKPLGEPLLLRAFVAGCPQIGQTVDNGHVGHPVGAGELERGLQPARRCEMAEDSPRLVQD